MKYLLPVMLAFFANNVFALTFSEIVKECNDREGNEIALKQFADSIDGKSITVSAQLEALEDYPVLESYARFTVDDDWSVDVYVDDDMAAQFRIGDKYRFTARIEGHKPFKTGLGILKPDYYVKEWSCDKQSLELKDPDIK